MVQDITKRTQKPMGHGVVACLASELHRHLRRREAFHLASPILTSTLKSYNHRTI